MPQPTTGELCSIEHIYNSLKSQERYQYAKQNQGAAFYRVPARVDSFPFVGASALAIRTFTGFVFLSKSFSADANRWLHFG